MEQGIDYRAWQFWLNVGQVVGYLVMGVWIWITNRQKATRDEISVVKKEMEAMKAAHASSCGKHQTRTTKLEEAVKNAPTHKDLGAVYDRVSEVKGSVDSMSGALKSISNQVNLLVEHHLRGGGR